MQHSNILAATNNSAPAGLIHSFLLKPVFTLILVAIVQLSSSPVKATAIESEKTFDYQRFLVTKVEGISLSTVLTTVPAILEMNGYKQTGQATYTKQTQAPGERKSVYRIEIEDTATQRQITYFRGETGGRIKSSVAAKPIPPNEAAIAREIYNLVCSEALTQIQTARSCLPMTESNISFGNGNLLEIGDNVGVQLSASATSTTITLRYIKD